MAEGHHSTPTGRFAEPDTPGKLQEEQDKILGKEREWTCVYEQRQRVRVPGIELLMCASRKDHANEISCEDDQHKIIIVVHIADIFVLVTNHCSNFFNLSQVVGPFEKENYQE